MKPNESNNEVRKPKHKPCEEGCYICNSRIAAKHEQEISKLKERVKEVGLSVEEINAMCEVYLTHLVICADSIKEGTIEVNEFYHKNQWKVIIGGLKEAFHFEQAEKIKKLLGETK